MCGRFTLTATPEALNQLFPSLFDGLELTPQYNVAPTQQVLAVRCRPDTALPEAVHLRWGLVPAWADDPKIGYRMINARLETAREKPAFRSAFKQRRCLVLADGYYEWQKQGRLKQPFLVHMQGNKLFAFAGLWEAWKGGQESLESCTILTTDANDLTRAIHDRMPVIVDPAHYGAWLDVKAASHDDFPWLGPYPSDQMTAVPVSQHVNNARHNDPACLTPVDSSGGLT
jgi:putative SOS response-associated peptidase YedK